MSNEILYILLPDYAAHEVVYLSQAVASDEQEKIHRKDDGRLTKRV